MGKSSKKNAVPAVVAADAPAGVAPDAPAAVAPAAAIPKVKPARKREAEDEIEKAASAKKQKPAPAKAVPVPKKASKKNKKQPQPKKSEIARSDEESSESEEPKKAAKPIKDECTDQNTYESSDQALMAKTLSLGNLPYAADDEDVKHFFAVVANPVSVRLVKHDDGHPMGFGYVKFATAEDAEKALVLNEQKLMDHAVRVERAAENAASASLIRDDGSVVKPSGGSSFSVFVNGFDKSKQRDDMESSLYKHFSNCGEITRVYVPMDHESGKIKGIAFVDFSEKLSVKEALGLSRSSLGGYVLHVEEAKPKPAGGGGWSGYRGGGGRYGGRGGPAFQSRRSAGTATAGKRIRFDND